VRSEALISIVTPFLNTPPEFLAEAVESVLSQSYPNWEMLLIDDGSSDESTSMALRYARQYQGQIRYLEHDKHQTRGASASRNLGIRYARGEYIGLLDADDVWLPHKLQQQVMLLQLHSEVGMVYGNTLYWYSWSGNPEDTRRDFLPRLGVQSGSIVKPPKLVPLFLEGYAAVPCTCSILIRRRLVKEVGGFDDKFLDLYTDQVFYSKVCLTSPVLVVDECWDRYRQRVDSSCSLGQKTGRLHSARLEFLKWLANYLREQGIQNASVWESLRKELRQYDDPGWLGWRQLARYVERRSKKLCSRIMKLKPSVGVASSK
jgi:glycosyltransferase involved in cell wall biosynthesis